MINKCDLRILKTHKNIKNTFSNLLLEKHFKDITVQNICDEALIGRSTFYAHFCDKYDLLNKMVEEVAKDFKKHIEIRFNSDNSDNSNDFTEIVDNMIKYLSTKKNTISALLEVHTETADLYSTLKNILIESCSSYLENKNFISKYNVSNKFICAQYAAYVLTSVQLWVESDEHDHTLELSNKVQALLFKCDNPL
ncbi:TetR/AcrR family transcriptional regulator [Clostridium sp. SHJSY1]|uniref:TetR/AcrR family transcriptional regulator n=1 Tax=Clostridium sp. SHJSY1 TaxID=2942483 RepID=UPI0028752CCE|nr:TetR/AcrR family transcriptional regulator [Clostridium sp. SHJSY1]MDS0527903.1 TetR/AcrR family transcriptional regulator [Clostridium sp. SHJSY1]